MSRRQPAVPILVAVGILLGLFASIPTAHAQYFGRNKVLYRSFDFKVLRTEHFDVYYYDDEAAIAQQAARMSERWYARISRVLNHELSNRQALILYASHPHFEQTNAIPGHLEESTGGVTESMKRRIVLPVGGSLAETDHVIGHELVHAFQYDFGGRSQGSAVPAVARLPLWFVEGMAEYLSIGPIDPHTAMWMRDAVYANRLPTVAKLNDTKYFPYRFGHAFWAYVGHRWGDRAVGELLRAAARSGVVESAISTQLGTTPDSLSADWHRELRALADRVPHATSEPGARPLVTSDGQIGRYNLAPAISPDGSRMMFLSERDLYTMELFLANARTGKIERRITRTAIDSHLQSLQFVSGSGAWSPDSRQFAFATIRDGGAVITIIDASSGHTKRRLPVERVDEVLSLSWSPDGATLAFSALAKGQTDLFTVPAQGGALRQWTDDLPADLQPAWSPDGTMLAFATERFTTGIDSLSIGALRLATLSIPGGEVIALASIPDSKHLNPQWSPDGKSLYAVVDRGGLSNVHRLDPSSGTWRRVTTVSTGVSGITAYSPAISVARGEDRMVFAGYAKGSYGIHSLDSLSARARPLEDVSYPGVATLVPDTPPGGSSALLGRAAPADSASIRAQGPRFSGFRDGPRPPGAADPGAAATRTDVPAVLSLLRNPSYGRSDTSTFHRRNYRPSLSLDRVSQVQFGIGTNGSGLSGVGGAALFWSDMLGNHNLGTYLEVSSNSGNFVRNVAAVADYQNLSSRWNWGLELSQLPYITRQFSSTVVSLPGGGLALEERDTRYWQIERRVAGTLAYPVTRADRFEFSAGYQNIDFAAEEELRLISSSGELLLDQTTQLDAGSAQLNLGIASAAYVHDNAFFGGTSPIAGSRYRLALEPVAGDLQYTGVLADYRTYLMPRRPWTLALRGLHYGRYGNDGESNLLTDLFVGYPNLMRGYDDASFSREECIDGELGPCPTFDRLFGSRIGVLNTELRVPLLGPFGLLRSAGIPPVEAAAFFDAGVAWNQADGSSDVKQNTVTSHGLAMRVNLFGFLVAEIDFVHPNQRPRKGWYWQFSVQPGF